VATGLLNPGGMLAIRVPNGEYYAVRMRRRWLRNRAFLAWNNLATFPYRHGFTPQSLMRLLKAHGYDIDDIEHDALVSISSEWTRAWARWEERVLKSAVVLSHLGRQAPWFEIYSRRS
jgi:hypothetical protein